ncbi:MAG TPA: hypothetical protein VMS96_13210 [Terriglobales bacterium]|nr:hypothetical protein [Terriglobales bacterium]
MTITIIFVAAGFGLAVFLFSVARGTTAAKGTLEEVGSATRPVDLAAFRNLVDPAEDEFLRTNLPAAAFRRVQRERLRAAIVYVERSAANAAVLLRIGEALSREDAEAAAMGREIANTALRLRVYALLVLAILHARVWFPSITTPVQEVGTRYEELRNQFGRLARTRRPAEAGHLLAAL